MWKKILIEFDPVTSTLKVAENDFTTFEAFGILEATKQMIAANWLGEAEKE